MSMDYVFNTLDIPQYDKERLKREQVEHEEELKSNIHITYPKAKYFLGDQPPVGTVFEKANGDIGVIVGIHEVPDKEVCACPMCTYHHYVSGSCLGYWKVKYPKTDNVYLEYPPALKVFEKGASEN